MSPPRYTVAVDFDGVLHRYDSPWVREDVIPDPPVEGAIDWLRAIAEDFDVVIHTTRGATPAGRVAVGAWLMLHGWSPLPESLRVTDIKPPALIYLDDRAWRFDGRFPTAAEIKAARPWNKPPRPKRT